MEILLIKPGAMGGSTALAQARKEGMFTPAHDAFWAAARTQHGQADGTRMLIEVLLLHRRMDHEVVLAGLAAAGRAGVSSPEVVAIEARKATAAARDAEPFRLTAADLANTAVIPICLPDGEGDAVSGEKATVISLRPRPVTPLPPDDRPLPVVGSLQPASSPAPERWSMTVTTSASATNAPTAERSTRPRTAPVPTGMALST